MTPQPTMTPIGLHLSTVDTTPTRDQGLSSAKRWHVVKGSGSHEPGRDPRSPRGSGRGRAQRRSIVFWRSSCPCPTSKQRKETTPPTLYNRIYELIQALMIQRKIRILISSEALVLLLRFNNASITWPTYGPEIIGRHQKCISEEERRHATRSQAAELLPSGREENESMR